MSSEKWLRTSAPFVHAFSQTETLEKLQMNEVLSSLHPYDFVRENDTDYSFRTDAGVVYRVYFLDYSDQFPLPVTVYEFNIEPVDKEGNKKRGMDIRIGHTIVSILTKFFERNTNAMLMVCDSTDGREFQRKLLFERWYSQYSNGKITKVDASLNTEDYMLYTSLFVHVDNPYKKQLIAAFYDLVARNMCPE